MEQKKFNSLLTIGLGTFKVLLKLEELKGYNDFTESHRDLAKELGISHTATRKHLIRLIKYDYISANQISAHKFIYHLNVEQVKQLLDE